MTVIQVADEGLHPANADLDWQESAYLAWRDTGSELGGNHRIGNEVNRGTANLWCGVYHADGSRFRHNGEDLTLEHLDGGLSAGPQRLFHDGEQVRFVLEGDGCQLDLELVDDESSLHWANAAAFRGSQGASGEIFSNNFHVFCRVRGTATLGRHTAAIDGWGWRDHSWGVRKWDSFVASRSFGGSLGPMRFRYGSMVGTNGSFVRHGSLERDGRAVAVVSAEMTVHVDDDSVRCPSAEVRYHLESGATTLVRIDTIGGMVGATRERYGWESVGDLTVDGEPGGWGFLEVNQNPRRGTEPPIFVLGDGLTNGLLPAP